MEYFVSETVFGEIAIFILKLSSKAQIRPSTIKMVGLVLEFAISVRFHPLSDVVFHTEAHSVSTVLLGVKKVIEDLASMNHSLTQVVFAFSWTMG